MITETFFVLNRTEFINFLVSLLDSLIKVYCVVQQQYLAVHL